ncbi:MAG: redoxin family protein [Pseudomonadota bacterium]
MRNVASLLLPLAIVAALSACDPAESVTIDAGPDAFESADYPPAPYGTVQGETIRNESWEEGYIDGTDADKDPFNEKVRYFDLKEVCGCSDPSVKIIVINSSAGWCPACQQEAQHVSDLADEYAAQGVRFISTICQTQTHGQAATAEFVKAWGDTFKLRIPTMVDPEWVLSRYVAGATAALPMHVIVNATNMEILTVTQNYDEPAFRQVLDYYLEELF